MGRTAEHTESDILAGGERLLERGREVTGWGLREELGGGKPPRLIAVWRAARGEPTPGEGPLPARVVQAARTSLQSAMDDAASGAIERLQAAAAEALKGAEDRLYKAVEEATSDATAAVAVLENELVRANERGNKTAQLLGQIQGHLEEAHRRVDEALAETLARRQQLAARNEELATSQERVAGLTEQVQRAEAARLEAQASAHQALVAAQQRAMAAEERERAALERAVTAEARLSVLGANDIIEPLRPIPN